MSDLDIPDEIEPGATPSDVDIAAWNQLPRDEQLRRMRSALAHPDCTAVGTATMDELRQRGQDRAAKTRNG